MRSNLGSPLQASAPIQLGGGESLEGLEVALASEADYRMVGKSMPAVARTLQVRLVDGDTPIIRLSSSRDIQDPLFEVMVRISSDGNQVLKMYTVALDPPQVKEPGARQSAVTAGAPERTEPPARTSPASGTRGDRPRIRTRELPAQARQEADAGPAVDRPQVEVTEGWSKRDRYGPVRAGDTLTTIVQRLRQDPSVPLESAVVATWKANSDAFIDGNMNLIQQGAVLDMPEASQVRQYQAAEAKEIIRKQREDWAERGKPSVKTSPGHERYKLKVSLRDPDAEPGEDAPPADSPKAADGQQGKGAVGGQGGRDGQAGQEPAQGGDQGAGEAAGQAAPESSAMIAELRGRISELQQSLESQRSDSQATIQSLESRMSDLQGELKEQRKLVAQQNAAMERLANQSSGGNSGIPGRDRYILWLLAGVNLLMLLAIVALWLRLRSVQSAPAPAPAAVGGGETGAASGPSDPLTQANAQAAAGEFKQARSTLWDALAGDPQNWALYGRLLDLYEQEGDADQFEEVARRLFDQLGDQQPEWQEEIRTRGQRLKPESPLFAAAAAGGVAAASAAPAFDFEGLDLESTEPAKGSTGTGEGEPSEGEAGVDAGFEEATEDALEGPEEESFDLDFGDTEQEPSGGQAPAPEPLSESEEEALDLGLGEDDEGPAPAPAEGRGEQADAEEDEGLEFDLGIAEDTGEPESDAGSESASASGEEATGEDDELVLSGWEADTTDDGEGKQGSGDEFSLGSADEDLDLTEPDESGSGPGGGETAGTGPSGEDELDLESLDWGEEETGSAPSGQAASPEGPETATSAEGESGSGEDEDLDFELSGWGDEDEDLDDQQGWSDEGPELEFGGEEGESASEPATASGGESSSEGGQDEDEFEIKLDLAQAWIDMGDQESARGLLEEVQSRGGSQQQDRARKMLDSLT